MAFPAQETCPRCSGDDVETVPLPDRGTLWSFTIQAFEPKAPYQVPADGFAPFGVGYVDLGDVIVESRLAGDTFRIGAPMALTLLDLWAGPDGEPVVTYAFAEVPGDA